MMKNQSELFANLKLVNAEKQIDPESGNTILVSFESDTSEDALSITVSIPEESFGDYDWITYNGEPMIPSDPRIEEEAQGSTN